MLLEVKNLKMYWRILKGYVKAVDDVSFKLEKGHSLGIAGESGCGKTSTALTILRLLPSNGRIMGGKVILDGKDLLKMNKEEFRTEIRWTGISVIFQGAMNALHPVKTVGGQISECCLIHENITKQEAMERSRKLLDLVGIGAERIDRYPHELSGGMKQRVMMAMALTCNPKLIIADEPTTALDVIVQTQVLKAVQELQHKLKLSMIFISHDLSMIAEVCNRVAIMYAGKIVEKGDIVSVYKESLHPYTEKLVGAFPSVMGLKTKLKTIHGFPPDLLKPPLGCRFHPRCSYAMDICRRKEPPMIEVGKDHYIACHLEGGDRKGRERKLEETVDDERRLVRKLEETVDDERRLVRKLEETVKVDNLRKYFPIKIGFFKSLTKEAPEVRAVDDISFKIKPGEVLGLAGESGCGKTTTGRCLLRLIEPTDGKILFKGKDIANLSKGQMRKLRKKMQIIFQDPYETLNPRMSIYDIIAEPLELQKVTSGPDQTMKLAANILEDLGLVPPEDFIYRFPHELSGGQRQRVAIARAFVVQPEFIVADEPVSMLDASIRSEVLELMLGLIQKLGCSFLYITHDIALIRYVCDRVLIMYLGKIVEEGTTEEVIQHPLHPYTEALIAAVPVPDPTARRTKVLIKGEVPDPINPPLGCQFHPRCPYAQQKCRKEEPKLSQLGKGGYVACHFPLS